MAAGGLRLHPGGGLVHGDAALRQGGLGHLLHHVLHRLVGGVLAVEVPVHRGGVGVEPRQVGRVEVPLGGGVEGEGPGGDLVVQVPAGVEGHPPVGPLQPGVDPVGVHHLVPEVVLHGLGPLDLRGPEGHVVLIVGHIDAREALELLRVGHLPGEIPHLFGEPAVERGAALPGDLEGEDALGPLSPGPAGVQHALPPRSRGRSPPWSPRWTPAPPRSRRTGRRSGPSPRPPCPRPAPGRTPGGRNCRSGRISSAGWPRQR